jgi:UPF0716 protein FxsA
MFARLLVLFVVVPLVEMYILFRIAELTSFPATVALVLATGALGAWLAKWQGSSTIRRIQDELAAGRIPGQALVDGAMILVAAALLLTPGILTDLFGFSLLMPPCRAVYRRLLGRMQGKIQWQVHQQGFTYTATSTRTNDPHVVDGEATPVPQPQVESKSAEPNEL